MKTIAAAVAALGLVVPTAQASTVSFAGDGALVVTAAPGERHFASVHCSLSCNC